MAWGSGGFKSCKALLDRVERNDPQLEELVILPMKTFGAAEVERLADILSSGKNKVLRSISASGHSVPASALETLGAALALTTASAQGCNIRAVAVGDEHMGDEGVKAFCLPLEAVKGGSLENIDFGFKDLSAEGAAVIGKVFGQSRNVKQIEIYRNPSIGDEGMVAFSSSVAAVAAVNEAKIEPFESLKMFDISECNVGEEGMRALVDCLVRKGNISERSTLLHLNANMNPLGAKACSSLATLISNNIVHKLSLRQCSVGDDGILSLVEAFRIGSGPCQAAILDLAKNDISARGATGFASILNCASCELKELILSDNPIGNDGILTLANALTQQGQPSSSINNDGSGTNSLQTLDLSGTKCGIEGAVAMLKCPSLKSIRLFNNNLGSGGFETIAPLLKGGHPTLEHLDLGGNRAGEDAVVTLIKALMVKHEPDLSKLTTLELGGNEVGEDVERLLQELEVIRPQLDIARDRPSVDQPNEFPDNIANSIQAQHEMHSIPDL